MSDTDEIAALRAENERLLKENFSLSAWQCEFADGKTGLVAHEHGGTYCAMAKENERLRAALQDIIADSFSVYAIQVARAALAAQPAPGKEEA